MSNITKSFEVNKDMHYMVGARSFGKEDLLKKFVGQPIGDLDATIQGTPTIDENFILSGTSQNDCVYFEKPRNIVTHSTPFVFVIKIKTATTHRKQSIVGQLSTNYTSFQIEYDSSGKIRTLCSPDGSNWVNGSQLSLNTNTWYYVKVTFTGSSFMTSVSTDGITWSDSAMSSISSVNWTEPLAIGRDSGTTAFNGLIDLTECYVEVNGVKVWKCVKNAAAISRNEMHNYVLNSVLVQPVIENSKAVIDFSNVTLPWKFEYKDKMNTSRFAIAPLGTTVTQTKYKQALNGTVVGDIDISDSGVASGFSSSNYLKPSYQFRPASGDTWEIIFKFKTPDVINSTNYLFQSCKGTGSSGRFGVIVYYKNGTFNMAVSSNGTAWLLDKEGTYKPQPSTVYWVRASFNGSQYKLQYSLDGVTYYDDIVYNSTSALYENLAYSYIGIYSTTSFENPNLGQIYLSDCSIKINGEEVWRGGKWVATEEMETLSGCIRYYYGEGAHVTTPPRDSTQYYNIYAVNGDEGVVLDSTYFHEGTMVYNRPILGDGPVPDFENEWYLGEYRVDTGEEGYIFVPIGPIPDRGV